jgi:hypothetical protein
MGPAGRSQVRRGHEDTRAASHHSGPQLVVSELCHITLPPNMRLAPLDWGCLRPKDHLTDRVTLSVTRRQRPVPSVTVSVAPGEASGRPQATYRLGIPERLGPRNLLRPSNPQRPPSRIDTIQRSCERH